MKIKTLINYFEEVAPNSLQESYDNSGLLIGSADDEVNKALISLDITEAVMNEAITSNCNLIIAHHPLIFKGIKRLNGNNLIERLILKAIKAGIAIYAIHTNMDNVAEGVNGKIAEKLQLVNTRVLQSMGNRFKKLVTFCPTDHADIVREAIFNAGGGHIGKYSHCSFNGVGEGSFKAGEGSNAFVGKKGELHFENEIRIETVVADYKLKDVVNKMIQAHPYEEVAYDIYPIENKVNYLGAGMIGELKEEIDIIDFLKQLKATFKIERLRHNQLLSKPIKKVAFCGGSGSFLIDKACGAGADVFITADVKYHDFFEHQGRMTIVDAGHYET